ncbi:Uncharacterised protein [Suttonella ornithocola]|uniref:Uncharacterized protein n=2 Tax=Suttonella ornithocola TaxID=279832 RepID=A0A380MU59_9GAMM|nr:Uncharacterised protein [Suttonella ornithocola]
MKFIKRYAHLILAGFLTTLFAYIVGYYSGIKTEKQRIESKYVIQPSEELKIPLSIEKPQWQRVRSNKND